MLRVIKLSFIAGLAVMGIGCGMNTNKFGVHSADYTNAKEQPSIKMPANSLTPSKRYEIPPVPASNTNPIITNTAPPDYFVN